MTFDESSDEVQGGPSDLDGPMRLRGLFRCPKRSRGGARRRSCGVKGGVQGMPWDHQVDLMGLLFDS